MDKITLTNAHGTFEIQAMDLDRAITRYLPASVAQLRATVCERTRAAEWVYGDMHDVSAFLVILASQDIATASGPADLYRSWAQHEAGRPTGGHK